jgi:Ca-activated chloride channel family protein
MHSDIAAEADTSYARPAYARDRLPHAVPEAERYAEFTENEFLDPKSSPLSTFSLDVDTTSYALMRRAIAEQKRLPPRTSVRIEEYVNYFHYDYPEPKGDDPIAVDCEMAPCPWNAKHKLARIGLQAKHIAKDKIPPCNLTFLVDVSGSMSWHGGIGMVKKGLSMLVGELRDEDRVAIVTYANGTEVRLPSTPGTDKRKILDVIDSLMAGGGTAGGAGIQLAYEEAKKNFDKSRNNRVILVTDGDFNIGISSPKELEDFIAEKRDTGVFLTVLGVGAGNYQDRTMEKLANAGNGNYAYIDSVLEAKKVFMDEFGGTLQTVAKDVKLQIEFNPAKVSGYRLLGYENRQLAAKDFNDDKKDAGEIGAGHTMTALYEIVPAGADEKVADVDPLKYQKADGVASEEAFTVKLRWKKPDSDTSVLRETPCTEAAITRKEPSESFRFASAVAEFALLLENSKFKGDASFDDVLKRARGAKGKDEEGYRAEFIRLVEAAQLYLKI